MNVYLTSGLGLAAGADDAQGARRHTVHGVVRHPVRVADCYAEPKIKKSCKKDEFTVFMI